MSQQIIIYKLRLIVRTPVIATVVQEELNETKQVASEEAQVNIIWFLSPIIYRECDYLVAGFTTHSRKSLSYKSPQGVEGCILDWFHDRFKKNSVIQNSPRSLRVYIGLDFPIFCVQEELGLVKAFF